MKHFNSWFLLAYQLFGTMTRMIKISTLVLLFLQLFYCCHAQVSSYGRFITTLGPVQAILKTSKSLGSLQMEQRRIIVANFTQCLGC